MDTKIRNNHANAGTSCDNSVVATLSATQDKSMAPKTGSEL